MNYKMGGVKCDLRCAGASDSPSKLEGADAQHRGRVSNAGSRAGSLMPTHSIGLTATSPILGEESLPIYNMV